MLKGRLCCGLHGGESGGGPGSECRRGAGAQPAEEPHERTCGTRIAGLRPGEAAARPARRAGVGKRKLCYLFGDGSGWKYRMVPGSAAAGVLYLRVVCSGRSLRRKASSDAGLRRRRLRPARLHKSRSLQEKKWTEKGRRRFGCAVFSGRSLRREQATLRSCGPPRGRGFGPRAPMEPDFSGIVELLQGA